MKKLEILVPQYKETEDIIKPLLDSIALQQAVDFSDIGVIICNDGTDVRLSEAFLDGYPYDIVYRKEPHRGVSATRNACFDQSSAEYVMWCDADDLFYSACALHIIFREMGFGEFDGLVSAFVEEVKRDGKTEFIKHENDVTFVHGKVFRRQYLIDNDIRWNDALTVHEDSYFNILAQSFSDNIKYCPVSFYLWKWRDASVCRHDPKYLLKTYNNMLDSNTALVKEFQRRGKDHEAEFHVVSMIFDAYYTMNKPEWIEQENVAYRAATESRFAAYYRDFKGVWDGAKPENKVKVSNQVRARQVREGMGMEMLTINQWLTHVETL